VNLRRAVRSGQALRVADHSQQSGAQCREEKFCSHRFHPL
jgi:hypothetical protein